MTTLQKYIYVLGDGNKIRDHIEYYLLRNELENLANLSKGISNAIQALKSFAISLMDAEVIMAEGDDILFRVEYTKYKHEHIQQLSEIFQKTSSCSISFGIGESVEEAYINLRKSKSSKTNWAPMER